MKQSDVQQLTDRQLAGQLEFFDCDTLRASFTSLLSELRAEQARRLQRGSEQPLEAQRGH